ncbi:MAG TPA: Ricin and poly(3-hydroxybutyrate) depolymerase fusion [Polyangiaceae bacterium]|nr:Ricin and poly(3-hydroxybutyrate) depolymerase fusion [Polyangiaceae bacterium]
MSSSVYSHASAVISSLVLLAAACSSTVEPTGGSGGSAPASGGTSTASGGTTTTPPGSGGVPSSGGVTPGSGGALATGGSTTSSGGASAPTGGTKSEGSGGVPNTTGGSGSGITGGANTAGGGAGAGGNAGASRGGESPGGGSSSGAAGSAGRASTGGAATSSGGTGGAAGAPTGSTGCGASDPLKSGRASIDVSGTKREYILALPTSYSASKPYKLIFAFHWKGGSANDVATGNTGGGPYYGLEQRAGGNAIFVAPEGIDAGFANTGGRDIALVKALLALFRSKLCIDDQRIFSTGFSYGGMMSDSIGCELADVFRAIAPMSGAIPNANHPYSGCNKATDHPIAVWMSHGDNDTVVPLADGKDALNLFVARNKCQTTTAAVSPSPCVAYQGCTSGYPIHFCQFAGGHGAPNFASAAIWAFFNQF